MKLSPGIGLWQTVFLTLLSLAVGILGGTVGLALGTMRLPFLLLLGVSPQVAGGTNILVSTLSAATGAYFHIRRQRVNWAAVLVQGIPAMVGALVGGVFADAVPAALLIALAGVLVVWQGVEFILRARREPHSAPARLDPAPAVAELRTRPSLRAWTPLRLALQALIGFSIGLLGGAVGLILGSLRLPALIAVLGLDPRVAAGTNLAIGVLMGAFGWLGHVTRGQVDYPLLVLMGLAGMVGNYSGARLTGRLRVKELLNLMAAVLFVVGLLLLWDAFRRAALSPA